MPFHAFFPGLVEFSEVSASDSAMAYMCAIMTDPVTGLLECSDPLIYAAMACKMDLIILAITRLCLGLIPNCFVKLWSLKSLL